MTEAEAHGSEGAVVAAIESIPMPAEWTEGDPAQPPRYAIAAATFYEELADRLVSGAIAALNEAGVPREVIDIYEVPGAFELPLAARYIADSTRLRYRAAILLGVVIRGETDHYDFVCSEAASGIQQVQLDSRVPCAFGLLTVDNMDQALARSGGDKRDQGRAAARAALDMAAMRDTLR